MPTFSCHVPDLKNNIDGTPNVIMYVTKIQIKLNSLF